MVKQKEEEEEEKESNNNKKKNITVGFIFADLKLFMVPLLLLLIFLLSTSLQLLPFYQNLTFKQQRIILQKAPLPFKQLQADPPPSDSNNNNNNNLVTKRQFLAVGSAAYLFVHMASYRGGPRSFAVLGLASKPLHVYSNPDILCKWVPCHNQSAAVAAASSFKMLPDWGYGRVYTVVVVNCTFASDVPPGGSLIVTATPGGGGGNADHNETFLALDEPAASVNMSLYASPPKYEYLYCGSPLYGGLSPQRIREWVAYHVKLFGGRSHFVIYDAGGVHEEVMEVLRPWVELGFVTLHDVRDQEEFDGYYHNQFLAVNDCLHRYRFMAKWVFFFDVDEFVYVDPRLGIHRFMEEMKGYTQFTIEQLPMSSKLCLSGDANKTERMWGMEKLVYKDVKRGIRRDRKYAIQPRNTFSAGVHLSQNFVGRTTHKTEGRIKYFHYHGTIANRQEPCREFVNSTETWLERTPYYRDETLRWIADSIKSFELKLIGDRLVKTRQ